MAKARRAAATSYLSWTQLREYGLVKAQTTRWMMLQQAARSTLQYYLKVLLSRGAACDAAALSGQLYVFGGVNTRNQHMNDLHRFNFQTKTWHTVSCENPPCARGNMGAAVLDGKVQLCRGTHDRLSCVLCSCMCFVGVPAGTQIPT